ncbi:hypothetical protein PDE_09250 [Penicillium oxalicum 114-2]|uniref:Peptidase A1 domain-containing protein n=1 Tax=Penicillium oxalicum (strain 114-2 / CGMCC 5302) TaxID=933388 RepID=S7ZZL5_PENO1|nr:hypothetical protein PDE_09250 [Penicillium oxalicum 114-2]
MLRPCVLWVLCGLCIKDVLAIRPWAMTWSPQKFGPDGPWQAVRVSIGGNSTEVALYPGATWTSEILLSTLCDNSTGSSYCYGAQAGLFNTAQSSTYDDTSIQLDPHGEWSNINYGRTNAVPINAQATRALDTIDVGGLTVPSVDLITISQGYQTFPGGKNYPLQVGVLSLGAPDFNQTFATAAAPINGTFVTSYLAEKGLIPTYSYGMHIGSASLEIPGSLRLGGYDRSRVIGEVSSQPTDGGSFPIQMVDISIGVAGGGSPWNSSSITGLLSHGNTSLVSGLRVDVDPANPYIYLPQSVCDAISAHLPVTHNSDLGLYFWNVNSPLYNQITASPSYLAFSFLRNGVNTDHITVKVPFALLNLTLEAPLVAQPTPYFPCMGTGSDPTLGRAFLQAAFFGAHWTEAQWFLAQAPGPDASFIEDIKDIGDLSSTSASSGNSWEGTWSKFWTPLSSSTSSNVTAISADVTATATSTSGGGLSTGAMAGIGIGCGFAGLLLLAAALLFLSRRRSFRTANQNPEITQADSPPRFFQTEPLEVDDTRPNQLYELDHESSRRTGVFNSNSRAGRVSQPKSNARQNLRQLSEHSIGLQSGPYELGPR